MKKNEIFEYHFCQPWIDALGHPLSSTVKLFKLTETNINCKIYCQGLSKLSDLPNSTKIKKYKLAKFQENIHITTSIFFFRHLIDIYKKRGGLSIKIFYIDSSPILLILFSIIFSPLLKILKVNSISTVLLANPEKYIKNFAFKFLIRIVNFSIIELKFFSRTQLINQVYQKKFKKNKQIFQLLPMLEMMGTKDYSKYKYQKKNLSFGIFGQLRDGKSINELVNYFSLKTEYELIIAGKSWTNKYNQIKDFITPNISIFDKFLSIDELDQYASKVDYHLLLYSFPWDIRMESGNYYLALAHSKPVITFKKGWIGNEVKKNKNGFIVSDFSEFETLLNNSEIISTNNMNYKRMQLNSKIYVKNNYPHQIIQELFSKL